MKRPFITLSLLYLFGIALFANPAPHAISGSTDVTELEASADNLYKTLWWNNWGFNCRPQILGLGADDIAGGSTTKRHFIADELALDASTFNADTEVIWQNMYTLIQESSKLIETLEADTNIPQAEKQQYLGEACFLKAFAYFQLVRWFGDVPAYKDADFKIDILGRTDISRNTVKDIYEKVIIPDLQKAESYLPDEGRREEKNATATKWAAKACLAEAYLTMAGWPLKQTACYALARDKAKEIINSGKYSLKASYADLWKTENIADNTEHIFSLNHAIVGPSNYGISYMTEVEEGGWSDYLADSCFYERYPNDERKTFNFITEFKVGKRDIDFRNSAMRSPAINKYRDYGTGSAQTGGITPLYRYADILLIYAEAQNMADNGPDALAYTCINQVRQRANGGTGNDLAPGMSKDDFNTAVFNERGWEFFAEFKRWFQLQRTEKVFEANQHNPRVKAALQKKGITADNREVYLMPLPVEEAKKFDIEIKDGGFENADLTLNHKEKPYVYGRWAVWNDPAFSANQNVDFRVEDDPQYGKVGVIEGRSHSWYTAFLGQRIKGKAEKGIYRLSFRAKSTGNAQLRAFFSLTNENGDDQQKFFIKETGKPENPESKWYGAYAQYDLNDQWTEYSFDFNFSKTCNSFYEWAYKDAVDATATDLTDFSLYMLNNKADAIVYIDNVRLAKVATGTLLKAFDFEGETISEQWNPAASTIALSTEHKREGGQSLRWDANDKSTLTLALPNILVGGQNSAFFNIYNPVFSKDTLVVDFMDSDDNPVKTARVLLDFKGWRDFNRTYGEYANSASATISQVRFTYKSSTGQGGKLYFDNMNFETANESKWRVVHQDLMVLDVDYLLASRNSLVKVHSFKDKRVIGEPTAEELADYQKIKPKYMPAPSSNSGRLKQLKTEIPKLGLTRNSDGTISGPPLPIRSELTMDYMIALSQDIEVLAAGAKTDEAVKALFNDYLDYVLEQGVLYQMEWLNYTRYNQVQEIPKGFLNAIPLCTDAQREEIVRAMEWALEFSIMYADDDYFIYWLNADYLVNHFSHINKLIASQKDDKTSIQYLKDMVLLFDRQTQYTPGSRAILKVDGTGFHHNCHYNAYMYAYKVWIGQLYELKGTCFKVKKDTYERIKKAVVSMSLMGTKSATVRHFTANSLSGRHPYTDGGSYNPVDSWNYDRLVQIGGDILGTGAIDPELAAYYNYFFETRKYDVDPVNPDGYYQFNFSPSGVYRKDNWIAVMHSFTTKFQGSEIYDNSNLFGRYQSNGTLEVIYDGAFEYSGYPSETAPNETGSKASPGWDWNVVPGATTVHYTSWEEMMPRKSRIATFYQHAKTTNFSGALSWGDCGVFATDLDPSDDYNGQQFTPTNLSFKKSVYSFDGMLISLGSDIEAAGNYSDDMITATNLFQGLDHNRISGELTVNGTVMEAGAEPVISNSETDLWLVTPQTTGYFVPKGNDQIVIKHGNQSAPREDGSDLNNLSTVVAAKAYINHGVKPTGKSYNFVVVPGTTPGKMQELAGKLANNGGEIYKIEACNDKLHALTYKPRGIVSYTFFGAVEGLDFGMVKSTDSEMLLMEKYNEQGKTIDFAVTNPNLRPESHPLLGWVDTPTDANIIVKGEWKLKTAVEGVTATILSDGTTRISIHIEKGEPLYFTLLDKDASGMDGSEPSRSGMQVTVYDKNAVVKEVTGYVYVYDIAGKLVASGECDGSITFSLPNTGYYIIKCENQNAKIVIR